MCFVRHRQNKVKKTYQSIAILDYAALNLFSYHFFLLISICFENDETIN